MKIYKKINVYDAALNRLRYIFDEFENVVVGYSGGKDSTVILNLALLVAKEKDRLPLSVIFIDQEAEWQGTIDVVKKVMYNPDVKPYWYQMPMVITNNASSYDRYRHCWDEEQKEKWIHPKDDISIKENTYGTERFHELFEAIFKKEFNDQKSCYLAGVRTEEAPKRFLALTEAITYKHITYGKILNKSRQHFTFYPIYDWSYTDVWKAIHDNQWDYNKVYDGFYRNGVTLNNMRISNVHHETAIQALMLIQEIEPKTWERVSARINGANTIKHLKTKSFQCPKELPTMFVSWEEYAFHLANNLIQEQKYKDLLLKKINKYKDIYSGRLIQDDFYKTIIKTILSSDWDFTKFSNWLISGEVDSYRRFYKKTNLLRNMLKSTKFLETHEKEELIEYFKTNK